jgi:hypothetical protein
MANLILCFLILHTNEDSSSPTSPCPDVFRYEVDRSGNWHGIISVPNPYPVVAIDIKVELYVAALASVLLSDFV